MNIEIRNGRVIDPARFADITLAVRNGAPVRISDIATVVDGSAEQRSAALLNGQPVVGFEISRSRGAGELDVAAGVREALASGDMARAERAELAALLKADGEKWGPIVKAIGFTAES